MAETVDPLIVVVVAAGAAITIGSAAVAGLKLERWARRYCSWLPANTGAPLGLLVGIVMVLRWLP